MGRGIRGADSIDELITNLAKPRVVWSMIPAAGFLTTKCGSPCMPSIWLRPSHKHRQAAMPLPTMCALAVLELVIVANA